MIDLLINLAILIGCVVGIPIATVVLGYCFGVGLERGRHKTVKQLGLEALDRQRRARQQAGRSQMN